MFLLGNFDLTRCEAIPNILNIFISHPYAWSDQHLMNALYAVWPFSSGPVGKIAAGRHERVGVSTDSSVGFKNTVHVILGQAKKIPTLQ